MAIASSNDGNENVTAQVAMDGGTISHNEAINSIASDAGIGGGICVGAGSRVMGCSLELTGGTIRQNTAVNGGGMGVYAGGGYTYFIYRVQVNGTVYVYDNAEVESGLLYDLAPGGTYTILTVGTAGDINHEAAQSGALNVSVSTNPAPTGSWADHADTSWYDSNDPQTEYILTTAAQLAGWSKLSKQTTNRVTFDGVTIKLGGDIDLSAYQWVPIASFGGTLDGQGHTICGVYVSAIASGGEGFIDSAAENTIIQNVTLEDSYIHPWDNTRWDYGGLIAKPYSPTLKNCHSTAFADGPNPAGRRFIGNSTTFPTTLENCGTPRPNVKKGS